MLHHVHVHTYTFLGTHYCKTPSRNRTATHEACPDGTARELGPHITPSWTRIQAPNCNFVAVWTEI